MQNQPKNNLCLIQHAFYFNEGCFGFRSNFLFGITPTISIQRSLCKHLCEARIFTLQHHVFVCHAFETKKLTIPIFHYTCCIAPMRATSLRGPFSCHCAFRKHISFQRNVAAVAIRWQHCVQIDRSEIRTSNHPLQRRTRHRSTNFIFLYCIVMVY